MEKFIEENKGKVAFVYLNDKHPYESGIIDGEKELAGINYMVLKNGIGFKAVRIDKIDVIEIRDDCK